MEMSKTPQPAIQQIDTENGTAETKLIAKRLIDDHDAFVFDMDGVLWRGSTPIEGAADAIRFLASDRGKKVFFATNNATSTRKEFVEKLDRLGFGRFSEDSFYCTAWVAAEVLRSRGVKGKVLTLGTEGLAKSLSEVEGVEVVTLANWPVMPADFDHVQIDNEIRAVVVGFDPNICYYRLAYATCILREKSEEECLFIVTNEDINFPVKNHKLPGNGSLVKSLISAVGRAPIVCGKPNTLIADHIVQKHNLRPDRICMVGDNLLTDITFGSRAHFTTLLVESGMHNRQDVKRLCSRTSGTKKESNSPSPMVHKSSMEMTSSGGHTHSHNVSACRMHSGSQQQGLEAISSVKSGNCARPATTEGTCVIQKSLRETAHPDFQCGTSAAVETVRERRRHEREDLRVRRRSEREESYERRLRLRQEDEERRRQVRREIAERILVLKQEEEQVKERLRAERKTLKERQRHEREESQERRLRLEAELEAIEEKLMLEREREREEDLRERDELKELKRREKEELRALEARFREDATVRKSRARQEKEELEERLRREREKLREKYELLEREAEERIRIERAELEKHQRHRRSESQERHAQAKREAADSIRSLEQQIETIENRMKQEVESIREKLRIEKEELQQRLERELAEFQRRHKEQYEVLSERRRMEREESQERRRRFREDSQERKVRLRRECDEIREIHRAEKGVAVEHYKTSQAEKREKVKLQRQEELEIRKKERDASLECVRRERQASLERAKMACQEADERRRRHAAECHFTISKTGASSHHMHLSMSSAEDTILPSNTCETSPAPAADAVPLKPKRGFLRGLISRDSGCAATTETTGNGVGLVSSDHELQRTSSSSARGGCVVLKREGSAEKYTAESSTTEIGGHNMMCSSISKQADNQLSSSDGPLSLEDGSAGGNAQVNYGTMISRTTYGGHRGDAGQQVAPETTGVPPISTRHLSTSSNLHNSYGLSSVESYRDDPENAVAAVVGTVRQGSINGGACDLGQRQDMRDLPRGDQAPPRPDFILPSISAIMTNRESERGVNTVRTSSFTGPNGEKITTTTTHESN
eukprot:Blabericola_migrator_1__6478@NODE_326_length_9761_cov_41_862080_g263_i0_p1_GENE_NODE_326_length_9761_cov_41_862080_g263_i0NODE_326_length_9761_cov_41_862080_g263_i0_p1_ORF_typecomplete_len1066_score158_30Hydrolase_6/PF13344_6/3_3e24Hydrolase_like/PF13242_6/3_7e14HAD_2/PF13419_6/0_13HAD_2/PF13419_6/8_2e05HAD_2/PF13419_6/1_8e04PGP_phosphatase/PF09419_10/3_8e02PGP_phosphatase/PF09419_10/0_00012Acid_phosphat_B/PF03767_14/0_31_NODE_326_length_9761_cov_41_862080_g263_i0833280